jgi:4-amino-4-deoxy-L-arabinose transferase-like glycosyltransferase
MTILSEHRYFDKKDITTPQRVILYCLWFVLAGLLFYNMNELPLRDYRETRFAEIAREVLEANNWLVPHLNGSPYLNKPPLFPWSIALSFKAFDVNESAARLPSALAFLWTSLMVGRLTSGLFGRGTGIMGAAIFLGLPGIQYYGRMLMSDSLSMAWITTAIVAFSEGYLKGHRRWYSLGLIACGLGVLSRGLIGIVYPLGALFLFVLLVDRTEFRRLPWILGPLLFLAVTAPWFALLEMKYPGFLRHQFVDQQVTRVISLEANPFVAIPRWQILLGLAGFLGPWTLTLPWIFAARGEGRLHFMLWGLAGLVVASVILSFGRNHPYILPALPPLAVLIAGYFGSRSRAAGFVGRRGNGLLICLMGAVVLGGIPLLDDVLGKMSITQVAAADQVLVKTCLALVACFVLMGGVLLLLGWRVSGCAALIAVMIPGAWMILHVQQQTAPVDSRAFLGRFVEREVPADWPLVIADPEDRQFEGTGGWGFYAKRRVQMVAFKSTGRLWTHTLSRPDWIWDADEVVRMWNSGQPMALAATPSALEALSLGPLPPRRARDSKFGLWISTGSKKK